MENKIQIRIRSQRHQSDNDSAQHFAHTKTGTDAAEPPEEIDLIAEGVMRTDGERWEIEYDESDISGLEGARTKLVFDTGTPDALTMMRRGGVSVTMVFSPGLRHMCRYETGIIPFELMLMTHSLDNTIPENGRLYVEYTTELAGGGRTRTKLKISIRKLPEDAGI